MRKKLGTRFPASRIKKIMQTDEDVGKIALAVPVLVSKALELFLQDLCDRTYEVTLQRGAKTINSLHLKQCVKSYSAFDFLTHVVNKVPSLGGEEPCGEERGITRRRKTLPHDDEIDCSEEARSAKMAMRSADVNPRGRRRGRGRGRGRPPTRMREISYGKFEDDDGMAPEHEEGPSEPAECADKSLPAKESIAEAAANPDCGPSSAMSASSVPSMEAKQEELSSWPLPDGVGLEPSQLKFVELTMQMDEDYDRED